MAAAVARGRALYRDIAGAPEPDRKQCIIILVTKQGEVVLYCSVLRHAIFVCVRPSRHRPSTSPHEVVDCDLLAQLFLLLLRCCRCAHCCSIKGAGPR